MLERALELGFDKVEAYEKAAEANCELGQVKRAALFLTVVAEKQDQAKEKDLATLARLKIRRIMPTDLAARRDLYSDYLERPEWFASKDYDPLQESVDLAWMLHCIGASQESLQVLLDYQVRNPGHWKTTQRLAQVAIDTGEPRVAVQILAAAADLYFKDKNWQQASRLYRQIRSIDPQYKEVDKRLRVCQEGFSRSQARSRKFLRAAMIVLFLGGVEAAYVSYSSGALDALRELQPEEMAIRGEFPAAVERLREFCSEYPVTVSTLVAQRMIDDLEQRADRV